MFAPRRVPPCFTASVLASYSFMKETGPDAVPPDASPPDAVKVIKLYDGGALLEKAA